MRRPYRAWSYPPPRPSPTRGEAEEPKRRHRATRMHILIPVYAVACVFGAAVVRGYSGFGFSLLAITSLSLLLSPAEIVPSIFIMEVVASLHLLPSVWRDIHWRALGWLAIGCLVGTPFGVYALAHVPAAPMTLALALFVLTDVTGLAWQGWNGLITWATLWRALTFLPPLAAGVWLGNHSFKKANPLAFRRWVLRLLMLLALLTGSRAVFQML